jgi:hypothetical protein
MRHGTLTCGIAVVPRQHIDLAALKMVQGIPKNESWRYCEGALKKKYHLVMTNIAMENHHF